jgi:DNA-entry nuclease
MRNNNIIKFLFIIIVLFSYAYFEYNNNLDNSYSSTKSNDAFYSASDIPDYNGKDIIILDNNNPNFNIDFDINESFELYGELDSLGRVSSAISNIGIDLMPTVPRESIRDIKPTGFKIAKYSIIEDGLYLFNRCHIIGYQLTGENDNINNLMTCTRYMNATLMEPYESKIASYIRRTKNHVLYRVTPVFDGDNLVIKGAKMEALSLEDEGKGIKFNIFIYNIQPGIEIDYKTGDSKLKE